MGEVSAMNAIMTIDTLSRPALALDVPKDQTFDQWVAMGQSLAEGQRVISWWIGDWWAAGSHRYGERAKAAAEGIFGREFGDLANIASVCRSFETSRRREHLTFTHHREVAALPPKEADALLDRAETGSLSTRELRVEAMKRKVALGIFKPRDQVDDDPDYYAIKGMAAAWNRGSREARKEFADMVAQSDLGVIEA